jgi:hypothetical protein
VTITKKITEPGITQGFTFDSNLSYDPSGTFDLQLNNGKPASQDFIRANSTAFGGPYKVKEQLPRGWSLTSITCSREGTASTPSSWRIDKSTASVAINLSGRDHVTCVYTDAPPVAIPAQLTVSKVTEGGTGGPFSFEVRGPVDSDLTATTAVPNQPVNATDVNTTDKGTPASSYTAGNYTITETTPPATEAGQWEFVTAYCDTNVQHSTSRASRSAAVDVTLNSGEGQACVFLNRFRPAGRIILRVKTIGGTGSGWFYVTPPVGKPQPNFAATKKESEVTTVYDENHLALQDYGVQSGGPLTNPAEGTWSLVSFHCDQGDVTVNTAQHVTISLTTSKPKADCLAVYRFDPVTTVEVTKTAQGAQAARSGPAVVDIGCAEHASGRVVLAETASYATLPKPLYLYKDVTCTVSEPDTGARAPENWKATATVNGRQLTLPGSFEVTSGQKTYVVSVTNQYRPAKIPGS